MISGMLWRVSKPSSHPFNICIIFLFPTRTGDDRGDVCAAFALQRGFLVYLRIGENLR